MDDFLVRALLGGVGVALMAGPLGAFVVWRRMAYFGDTISHSALLGIALGLLLGIDLTLGVAAVGMAIAIILTLMQRSRALATDTLLGIVAHATLAFGLLALAFLESFRVDLMAYLFGDILAVSTNDLMALYAVVALTLLTIVVLWRRLLMVTINEDLAQVEGIPVLAVRFAFVMLMAVAVAVAMKLVGILLITSLLIIPAATARRFSHSPEQMAVFAALLGGLAVVAGLGVSYAADLPTGPAIVASAAVLFGLGQVVPARHA